MAVDEIDLHGAGFGTGICELSIFDCMGIYELSIFDSLVGVGFEFLLGSYVALLDGFAFGGFLFVAFVVERMQAWSSPLGRVAHRLLYVVGKKCVYTFGQKCFYCEGSV